MCDRFLFTYHMFGNLKLVCQVVTDNMWYDGVIVFFFLLNYNDVENVTRFF